MYLDKQVLGPGLLVFGLWSLVFETLINEWQPQQPYCQKTKTKDQKPFKWIPGSTHITIPCQ